MATERKVPRALEQIAALVLQHELACPKRTNGHENALAEIDSQQCRASASIPTASLHADVVLVWSTSTLAKSLTKMLMRSKRFTLQTEFIL